MQSPHWGQRPEAQGPGSLSGQRLGRPLRWPGSEHTTDAQEATVRAKPALWAGSALSSRDRTEQSLGLCVCRGGGHSTYSVGILGGSGSQRQDQGAVLWVWAPTQTVCQREALLGEACDTVGSWAFWAGLGVCLSGEQQGQGTAEPHVAGAGQVSGERLARPWQARTGPLREPEGSRELCRSKQGAELSSM